MLKLGKHGELVEPSISMKDQLLILFQLNELDRKIFDLQKKLEGIPAERADLRAVLEKKHRLVEELEQKIVNAEKERVSMDERIRETETRLRTLQAALATLKTNQEYQSALKEMDEGKSWIAGTEDSGLEIIQKIEGWKEEIQEQKEFLHGSSVATAAEEKALDSKARKTQSQIGKLSLQREEFLPKLDPKMCQSYEKILATKPDALVSVQDGVCQGCFLRIQPRLLQEIIKGTSFNCPSCHRLLYLPEWK